MGKKRKTPGLNTSSTADISFILLIFFLITTSMDTDCGLSRRLPPPPDPNQEDAQIDVKERNVLNVRLNAANILMVSYGGNDPFFPQLSELCKIAKDFVKNEDNNPHRPEKHSIDIAGMGVRNITDKHVISVQTDRGTSYDVYFAVQNELVRAYNELRDELAKTEFHKASYADCTKEQKDAIRVYYAQKISEAEPKNSKKN